MKLCVLISTMFCEDVKKLIDNMNIRTDCIVVNQCDISKEKKETIEYKGKIITFISTNERGLSKSRNKALSNVSNDVDVVIFTDDDILFIDDYENNILDVYKDDNVDGCAFSIIRLNGKVNKKLSKKINKITMLRVCSVSMTFRYKSIKNMKFDVNFGTGSGKYTLGEENIFICDCLNNKLNIISNTYVMCKECNIRKSTWYKGMNKEYFISRGAVFRRLYNCLSWIFILDFALRKRKRYKDNMSTRTALEYMFYGSKQIKKENKNG